jgi:hypothetical protein
MLYFFTSAGGAAAAGAAAAAATAATADTCKMTHGGEKREVISQLVGARDTFLPRKLLSSLLCQRPAS